MSDLHPTPVSWDARTSVNPSFVTLALGFALAMAPVGSVGGTPLKHAHVSQVIQDVKLLAPNATPRPAEVNDRLTQGMAVRTGIQSRAELTFTDLTITRLGENTVFTCGKGARQLDLTSGSVLVQVRPDAAPVHINTAAVSAAVSGGTAMFATGPPTKFMVLEGTGTFHPLGHPGETITLHGGEMVMLTSDGHIIGPMTFNVKEVMETSHLITDFPDLANLSLILDVISLQQGSFFVGASPPPQKGIIDVTDQAVNSAPPTPTPAPSPLPSASPSATPGKYGPPSTIPSPDPYVIASGTSITTDPAITTNGVTNYGTIYRGPTMDGAFSLWAFGSTSSSDTKIGVDDFFTSASNLPIAVFKFQDLSITGDPTIDVSNGGATKLGLIGVDGITSGPPGGTLTFAGLDTLALGTVNGSVDLTSDVAFDGINMLYFYARGTGSNLSIASPLSNVDTLRGVAGGGDITVTQDGSLVLSGTLQLETAVPTGGTVTSGANVSANIGGDLTTNKATFTIDNTGGNVGTGGNLTLNTTGNFTTTSDATFQILNNSGVIGSGGSLTVQGGTVSIGGILTATIDNAAGDIAGTGNIGISAPGGDLTAGSIDAEITNYSGGSINGDAMVEIDAAGGINANSLTALIDNSSGGSIGSDATVEVNTANISASSFDAEIDNGGAGTISGGANVSLDSTGDVTVPGASGITLQILNEGGSIAGGMPGDGVFYTVGGTTSTPALALYVDNSNGGVINTGGNVTLNTTGPVMMDGPLVLEVDTYNGGSITSGGNLIAHFVGDVTDTSGQFHSLNFFVLNGAGYFNGDVSGGTIGTGGNIDVTFDGNAGTTPTSTTGSFAAEIQNGGGVLGTGGNISLTVGGDVLAGGQGFNVDLANQGGQIANGGNVAVNVEGDITSVTGAFFGILNQSSTSNGGTIGSDATVNVDATNVSTTGDFDAEIDNYNGGSIGGNATVGFGLGGTLTSQSNTIFSIDNSNGGIIGQNAVINVSATGDLNSPNGTATFYINNTGGTIGAGTQRAGTVVTGAGIDVTASNISTDVNVALNSLLARIDNGGNGFIATDATVLFALANAVTSGELAIDIENDGGQIGSSADVEFDAGGSVNVTGPAFFDIGNPNGLIGTDAIVNVNANSISSSGDFVSDINDQNGSIGGQASLAIATSNDLDAGGNAFFTISNNPGAIGSSASVNVSATTMSVAGALEAYVDNTGGSIGGDATVQLSVGAAGDAASSASAGVVPPDLTADSLSVQVNNTNGSIGGDATINMNVSGTANVTNDATVQILGNDPTGSAAINFNGGGYDVGGTFLNTIDGNGTITFANSYVHADVLKVGVFGTDGTLIVGGSTLSGDSELKLYAPGSNGFIHFVSNVTLNGSSTAAIIAANTVTIDNRVTVTIGGPAALVYANVPNYAVLDANGNPEGGNGSTSGRFGGAGASTSPLANAPPFGPSGGAPSAGPPVASSPVALSGIGGVGSRRSSDIAAAAANSTSSTIKVNNSDQLLSLLDGAAPGPDGKVAITVSKNTGRSNPGRPGANDAIGAAHRVRSPQVNNFMSGRGRTSNRQALLGSRLSIQ
jgi:fibronectin-binding autotransporter adhesin